MKIPKRLALQLYTTNGAIEVEAMGNSVTASSTNGSIDVDGTNGEVNLSTTNGSINAMNITGRLEAAPPMARSTCTLLVAMFALTPQMEKL